MSWTTEPKEQKPVSKYLWTALYFTGSFPFMYFYQIYLYLLKTELVC